MKYMGIDYGARKIGIAFSDERGVVAFPHSIISNDDGAITALLELVAHERAEGIVAGDTRTESGAPNDITDACADFVEKLERAVNATVILVREHGTSAAARAMGENDVDARAAALILQRFLDANQPVVE